MKPATPPPRSGEAMSRTTQERATAIVASVVSSFAAIEGLAFPSSGDPHSNMRLKEATTLLNLHAQAVAINNI